MRWITALLVFFLLSMSHAYHGQTVEKTAFRSVVVGQDNITLPVGLNVTLIDNTDVCLIDCHSDYWVCAESEINKKDLDAYFLDPAGKDRGLSYSVQRWAWVNETRSSSTFTDKPYDCDIVDNSTNKSSPGSCHHYSVQTTTYTVAEFKPYDFTPFSGCAQITVSGKKKPLEDVDAVPRILGTAFPEFAWWNGSFAYRYPFNFSNNNGRTLFDYAAPAILYLNSSHTNGSDCRVTIFNSTNTTEVEASFWRAEWTIPINQSGTIVSAPAFNASNASGTFWINVSNIANGTNTTGGNVYCNATGGTDASNGSKVFKLYNDGTNTVGFTTHGNVSANGVLNMTGADSGIVATNNITVNSTVSWMGNYVTASSGVMEGILTKVDGALNSAVDNASIFFHDSGDTSRYTFFNDGYRTYASANIGPSNTAAHNYSLMWANNITNTQFIVNGTVVSKPSSHYPSFTTAYLCLGYWCNGAGANEIVDNITVREWVLNEPTFVQGAEEANSGGSSGALNVTINSPGNSTYNTSSLVVNITCTGDNSSYYENVSINGSNILTNQVVQNATPYNFTTNISDGFMVLNATCWNGSYQNSTGVYFTVNITPVANVTLISPVNSSYSASNQSFNASCFGSFASYLLNITLDGNQSILNVTDQNVTNGSSFQVWYNLTNGSHNVTASCANGTTSASSPLLWFFINTSNTFLMMLVLSVGLAGLVTAYKMGRWLQRR